MSTKESLEGQVLAIIQETRKETPARIIGNKKLAEKLGVSRKQIKRARRSIVKKLGRKPGF